MKRKAQKTNHEQLKSVLKFLGHTCPHDLYEMGFNADKVCDIVSFYHDNQRILDQ